VRAGDQVNQRLEASIADPWLRWFVSLLPRSVRFAAMIGESGPAAGPSVSVLSIQRRAMPSVSLLLNQNGMSSSGTLAITARLIAAVGLVARAFGVATAGTYFFTTALTLPTLLV